MVIRRVFWRSARIAAGTSTFLVIAPLAAPPADAECGCWRYVRPSAENADAELSSVTVPAHNIGWAAGSRGEKPLLLGWNGSRWREHPLPLRSDTLLEGVAATSPRNAWLVGYGPDGSPRTARLHGGKWRNVPMPKPGPSFPRDVDVLPTEEAWVAGSSSGFAGTQATIWHWDKREWRTVPIPGGAGVNSELTAVSASGPADAWAVGTRGAYPPNQLLLHWDGKEWTRARAPEAAGESTLADVVSLRPELAWVVGSTRIEGADTPLAQRWDGKSWTAVPMPGVRGRLYSVAGDGSGGVWAAGEDHDGRLLLTHWNGLRWDVSTGPVPDPSGEGDAQGPASAWGLAHTPGTPYLWAVGSSGRTGADPLRHALTWTNSPRPR